MRICTEENLRFYNKSFIFSILFLKTAKIRVIRVIRVLLFIIL